MKIRTVRRFQFWTRAITASCLLAIVVFEYARPMAMDVIYRDEYRKLTLECDQAMHDEVALRAGTVGGAKHPHMELSGAVGLSICHKYDKLRKKLLVAGISEESLALIGLEALENEQIPVSRMADPHRMQRF